MIQKYEFKISAIEKYGKTLLWKNYYQKMHKNIHKKWNSIHIEFNVGKNNQEIQ